MGSLSDRRVLEQTQLAELVATTGHHTAIAHQKDGVNLSAGDLPHHRFLTK